MRLTIALVVLAASVQSASWNTGQLHADEPAALVIKDTTLFDSASASMLPDRTIVIVGDTIRAVRSAQEPIAIPPHAHTIDGSGNNLDHPDWGKAGSILLRMMDSEYDDGASAPSGADRQGPRCISNSVFELLDLMPNSVKASDMLWQWG